MTSSLLLTAHASGRGNHAHISQAAHNLESPQNVARQFVAGIQRARGHHDGKTVARAAVAFCWPQIGESKRELPTVRNKNTVWIEAATTADSRYGSDAVCGRSRERRKEGDFMARLVLADGRREGMHSLKTRPSIPTQVRGTIYIVRPPRTN